MARSIRSNRRVSSRLQNRSTPYPLPSFHMSASKKAGERRKAPLASERKDWVDATCSVCMEFPHNAVLLLCSSHDKGCRPYMCGTSYRHSNCLDQFKKAYAKAAAAAAESGLENANLGVGAPGWSASKKSEGMGLMCPLCRGQVKGWTVVEPARQYLNRKKRSCMQDNCSFVGTYKELRKHVRSEHPCAKPRKVDPALEQKWRAMERQREREDVISTIRSSNPRSVVLGDYVIEMDDTDLDVDDDLDGGRGFGGRPLGLHRSFLYFLVQEGMMRTRLHRDGGSGDDRENGNAGPPLIDLEAGFDSGDDDVLRSRREMFVNIMHPDRRRRRRSRGRSTSGVS